MKVTDEQKISTREREMLRRAARLLELMMLIMVGGDLGNHHYEPGMFRGNILVIFSFVKTITGFEVLDSVFCLSKEDTKLLLTMAINADPAVCISAVENRQIVFSSVVSSRSGMIDLLSDTESLIAGGSTECMKRKRARERYES